MHPAARRFIRRVTLAYAVLATAWIFLSDRMLSVAADSATITELGTAKGIVFVTITSALLFLAMTHIPAGGAEQKAGVNGRSQPLFLVFLILTVTIAVIGVVAYRVQSTVLKQTEFDRLQAIAQLKVDDITRWMNGRRANARSFSRNPAVLGMLRHWLAHGGDEGGRRLTALLSEMRGGFGFSSVTLLDPAGRLLFAEGEHLSAPAPAAPAIVDAMTSGEVVFVDLHRDAPGAAAHMAFVVPVFDRAGGSGGVIAIIQLEARADRYLYPYIQSWPLPAATGETILVRREGEDIVFLNELRHRPDSALSLRLPITAAELPAAQAILYQKPLVDGLDYRGVRVLAAARPVPGTSWTLIAKVDEAEALAGLKQLAFTTGILILAALAVSVCFVVFLWQRQRLRAALTEIVQGRALEEAEIRFRSTFEQAAVGIAHVGRDGRFLRVNQKLCSILGYGRDELLQMKFQDVTFSGDLEIQVAACGQLLAGDIESHNFEKRYFRKDGRMVWAALTTTVIRNAAGEPDYFVTVVEDISRRKEADEALQKRVNLQEYLGKIANTLPGAICSLRMRPDGSTCMPYASPNFTALSGLQPADVVDDATPAFKRVHADDLGPLQASLVASARAKTMLDTEFRVAHPDKGEIWVEFRGAPEAEPDGGTCWHGFFYDVTERKNDEARLRQAMTVFNSTQSGVCVTDAGGNIVTVNPAFSAITGYERAELIGKNPRLLQSGRHDGTFYRELWDCLTRDGFWQGEIWNRRKTGEIYPELLAISAVRNAKGVLSNYIATFTDISRIKQSESQLEHLAHHDPLTGLPNRLRLLSSLEHAIGRAERHGGCGAVLFLDLDRFKNVNDSMGHPAGDEMLVLVARRLREHVPGGEVLARLGGDEFVVLMDAVSEPEEPASLAETLIAQFEEPFVFSGGRQVYVGASIGISVFPDDGDDPNVLIQHADAALYQAKESGRGTYRFYSAALTLAADARLEMETKLRRGLERNEFVLHYQPLLALADGRIVGMEALLRWHHPTEGLVMPDTFIPLAEETGLIVPLGEWALRSACAQAAEWIAAGQAPPMISVNLSPRQLWQPDLHQTVRSVLKETGLSAERLELEITESALLEQGGEAAGKLNSLKRLGVRLAIDDFGTGYSSLAYLTRLPIDTLKIDKSFVRNIPSDRACMEVTAGIIALAKSLNLEVLAEGVETPEQLEFLKRHDCDRGQGYLFSRPLPAGDAAAMLIAFGAGSATYRGRTRKKKASA